MQDNDYIILFDEDGSPYIAHASWQDVKNTVSNAASSVANAVKGVGRGVRENHKYILKVMENGKARYFYTQEEVKAYYEAKKSGIKNAAEYAQNAVKNKTSELATKAKTAANNAIQNAQTQYGRMREEFREKTGQDKKERAEQTKREYQEAEEARKKAAGEFSSAVDRDLAASKQRDANPNGAYAQAERDRAAQNVREKSDAYYRENGALDTAWKKRDEAAKAHEEYEEFKKAHSPRAMIDKARETISEAGSKAKKSAQEMISKAKQSKEEPTAEASKPHSREKTTGEGSASVERGRQVDADRAVSGGSTSAPKGRKTEAHEYTDGDSDFDEKNYSRENHVADTDFYTFKRPDGRIVILQEDMKWVLPEGVSATDPGIQSAMKKFSDSASTSEAIGTSNYTADQYTEALTAAINEAAEKARRK